MTLPGRSVGSVWAELRVTTDKADDDVREGLDDLGNDIEDDPRLKRVGREMGDTIGKGLGDRIGELGPEFAKRTEETISKEKIKIKEVIEFDKDSKPIRRWVTFAEEELEQAFHDAGRPGGPLNKIGQAAADAIGAGFNISGRSPLIVLLVPLFAAIAELVGAAIESAGSLVALLTLIPGLLVAIGAQAGVLFAAFHGVGEAIQGAFAATNAQELNEALKNLTPSAQIFIKTLLPLRDFFKDILFVAQEGFFKEFGGSLARTIDSLKEVVGFALNNLAPALGAFFRDLTGIFNDPVFRRFFVELIPLTVDWIHGFGAALDVFFSGLFNLGHAVMPFLEKFGIIFNRWFVDFGQWLSDLSTDQGFLDFMDRMFDNFAAIGDVLKSAVVLIAQMFDAIDKGGGAELLNHLAGQLKILALFFSSDVGVKAMEGLIHSIMFLTDVFVGVVLVVGFLLAGLEKVLEFVRHTLVPYLVQAFTVDFPNMFTVIGNAILGFFTMIGDAIIGVVHWIGDVIGGFISFLFDIAGRIIGFFYGLVNDFRGFLANIGSVLWDSAAGFTNILYEAGRNIIQGLINGIRSMFPNLGGIMGSAMQVIRNFTPFSPAKEGPLSGSGDPMISGQKIIQRLAAGMEMEGPTLNDASNTAFGNVYFGPGSVRVAFEGVVPTNAQAMATGQAAGRGISAQLAMRDARLGVRMQ